MSLQTHYERDAANSGRLVAAVWRDVYECVRDSMNGCGQSVTNNYIQFTIMQNSYKSQLLQLYFAYMAASLNVQVAFIGVPDRYDSDPGDVGEEINQRNLALCIACNSWVDQTFNMAMSWIEGAALDAIPVYTGAMAVAFIPTPVTVVVGLTALFAGAIVHSELFNEDYRDYVKCAMYDALQGGLTTTTGAFDACFDSMPARPPPAQNPAQDTARDIIEAWLRAVVNDLENYLGFVSVLNAAFTVAATQTFESCGCATWEMVWLGGFNEAGDWDFVPFNVGYDPTTYNAGEDRAEGTCIVDAVVGAKLEVTIPATVLTLIRFDASWLSNRVTGANESQIWINDDFDSRWETAHGTGEGSHEMSSGAFSTSVTSIILRSAAGCNACGLDDYAYIGKITINGLGANPFV